MRNFELPHGRSPCVYNLDLKFVTDGEKAGHVMSIVLFVKFCVSCCTLVCATSCQCTFVCQALWFSIFGCSLCFWQVEALILTLCQCVGDRHPTTWSAWLAVQHSLLAEDHACLRLGQGVVVVRA